MSLTMRKGFFDDPRIRIIRRYGDKYVLMFMMLVGLSENDLDYGGLYMQGGAVISVNDLPALLGVSEETVTEALMLFDSLEMFEIGDDGVMYVNYAGLFCKR